MSGICKIVLLLFILVLTGCAPLEVISTHDFSSGRYKLKTSDGEVSKIYADVKEDSLIIYRIINNEPDQSSPGRFSLSGIDAQSIGRDLSLRISIRLMIVKTC